MAMSKNLVTLLTKSTPLKAVKTMILKNVSSIVITDGDKLKCVIAMKDILARVVTREKDPMFTRIKDVMSTPVICIKENADLFEGTLIAMKNCIKRLAVINEEGKLVGTITSDDVYKNLQRAAEELALTYHLISKRARADKAECF